MDEDLMSACWFTSSDMRPTIATPTSCRFVTRLTVPTITIVDGFGTQWIPSIGTNRVFVKSNTTIVRV